METVNGKHFAMVCWSSGVERRYNEIKQNKCKIIIITVNVHEYNDKLYFPTPS